MEKCTRAMGYVVMILIATLLITVIPTEADYRVYEDTIRLHILARTDSSEDQKTKLELRDMLLVEYSDLLSGYESKELAEGELNKILPEVEARINDWLKERGEDYSAECSLSVEWYERREYGEYTLPEGYYTSLRVLLGGGEGKNWWCVMYPPLCLDIATEERRDYEGSQKELLLGKYAVKLKLLEICSKLWGK